MVDVEDGKLLPDHRVVIAGNRIQAMGRVSKVKLPSGAHVVGGHGKYLIPGLWDMYVTVGRVDAVYPLLIVNGITGIRDLGHQAPIDKMLAWQREVRAGTRVGPRAVLGALVTNHPGMMQGHTLITTAEAGRHAVDSVKALGADFIVTYFLAPELYFPVAAQARRVGLPTGGYLDRSVSLVDASDSGQRLVENFSQRIYNDGICTWSVDALKKECTTIMKRLIRNGTWWAPWGIFGSPKSAIVPQLHRLGMPLLACSTTESGKTTIQQTLLALAKTGLTSLQVLQTATLNPAKFLNATDSLGTVAPGKLADLVLLDANPLADINNTTAIQAVVANGRYFDRAVLDRLLVEARAKAPKNP